RLAAMFRCQLRLAGLLVIIGQGGVGRPVLGGLFECAEQPAQAFTFVAVAKADQARLQSRLRVGGGLADSRECRLEPFSVALDPLLGSLVFSCLVVLSLAAEGLGEQVVGLCVEGVVGDGPSSPLLCCG